MKSLFVFIINLYIVFAFSQNQKLFSNYILNNPIKNNIFFDKLNTKYIRKYVDTTKQDHIKLINGYAEYKIKNSYVIKELKDKQVYKIDIVFTKYPLQQIDWITNYYYLLANRLKELFKYAPEINNKKISFNLLIQTACKTELQAKNMFHGIIVYYKNKEERNISDKAIKTINSKPKAMLSNNIESFKKEYIKNLDIKDSLSCNRNTLYKIVDQITKIDKLANNYVYNIFERHKEWNNIYVIMDWTGSMYSYSGQVILWYAANYKTKRIKNFVFFNDGNITPNGKKRIGQTGGIFTFKADSINKIIEAMYLICQNGRGGDSQENDIEALLFAKKKYPQAKELFLIADNNSDMRDYLLISKLKLPVHVILCRKIGKPNLQYLNLAYKTGGTIHYISNDIENFDNLKKNKKMTVFGYSVSLKNDEIVWK